MNRGQEVENLRQEIMGVVLKSGINYIDARRAINRVVTDLNDMQDKALLSTSVGEVQSIEKESPADRSSAGNGSEG